MTTFKDVFDKIAEGLQDLRSLEVLTYRGTIRVEATGAMPGTFAETLANARTQADLRIVASTLSSIDGDTKVFYGSDATEAEIAAHNQIVESAVAKRAAILRMFESAIVDRATK
jgi:hypothetical protein